MLEQMYGPIFSATQIIVNQIYVLNISSLM